MIRVLVCGGRNYNDWETFVRTLDNFCLERNLVTPEDQRDEYGNYMFEGLTIISGAARGADTYAIDWAVVNWVPFEEYKADWDTHGKKAGILRNIQMLEEGKPDVVIAFPGGRGTAHMVSISKNAGVEVIEVSGEGSTFPKTTGAEGRNFVD